tara:strand:+ start:668 stop:1357 length:690 start_codon:yes stop_codon:yes gene_type:complete
MVNYKYKYLKYKLKYLTANKLYGGCENDMKPNDGPYDMELDALSEDDLKAAMVNFNKRDVDNMEKKIIEERMDLDALSDEDLKAAMVNFNERDVDDMKQKIMEERMFHSLVEGELSQRLNENEQVEHFDADKCGFYYGQDWIFGSKKREEEAVANTSLKTITPYVITKTIDRLSKKETRTSKEKKTLIEYSNCLKQMQISVINTNLSPEEKNFHLRQLQGWINIADKYI